MPPRRNVKSTGNNKENNIDMNEDSDTAGKFERSNGDASENSITQLLLSIQKEMIDMRKELSAKLSENQTEIRKVREELCNLKETVRDIEQATESHAERLDDIEQNKLSAIKNEVEAKLNDLEQNGLSAIKSELESKINHVERAMLLSEIHDRKQNLLFYGLPEKDEEEIFETMAEVFEKDYGLTPEQANQVYVANVHRLPTRNSLANGAPAPRPIICRFVHMADRNFFGNSKNLRKDRKIRVLQDLPPTMKRERGRLSGIAYKLRTNEDKITRIRVVGTRVVLEWKPKYARGRGEWEEHHD